jgi:glycosyltransferase involved in cell wall biosynthesis
LAPHVIILGIRGIPAAHGGFETFAERLASYLHERGWRVTVYCQGSPTGRRMEDNWNGIRRIHLPVKLDGSVGTIEFDLKCVMDVARLPGTILTLGYNTGFLSAWLRLRNRRNLVNMDGLEWKRAKYSAPQKAYLWINERLAAWGGASLIADHPQIARHLETRVPAAKITMIPYGSDRIAAADPAPLAALGLEPGGFFSLVARPVPENSVLEIVRAFSAQPRGVKLALLGNYTPDVAYEAAVRTAAGPEVVFTGAIYDRDTLAALRGHSIAYLHGHQVGGTNPSLVEALGAGSPVIAHDNAFNRWVAGDAAVYFSNVDRCAEAITRVLHDAALRDTLGAAARRRWESTFTWDDVLEQYLQTLL